ncbi:bacteriocin-protection protein, YdeI/OmpD-associated family [Knoellia sinensis KCTC 19936]|uniref:Bacteriocin-protection protein, YdeI/OmpD-associated family n=1 Tax=Knoellia sinensis KCTC 19936 TaxID=1385520 RepID=A0A0A0JB33_9MICO|nr:YdeI/OmpD-associated family protein [Knoellia sinensis]KGN34605.1 bacteriocin-protection protein, YdeI/OmpD-associated family [Knoellia sinensis KCTC 19936]
MVQIGMPGGSVERPALFFRDEAEFEMWLEANHETATELWMGLFKKHVDDPGLTWEQAVPVALCFGWIDSVSQRIDEDARRQRWTPRKSSSIWSAINIAHVERLSAEGRMRPAGIAAFEKRKPERSGIYAYEAGQALSDEQRTRLLADPAAAAFWQVATPSYRKMAENWVVTAKREDTREKRLAQLIDDCAQGRLIPPQRYGDEPKWVARAAAAAAASS